MMNLFKPPAPPPIKPPPPLPDPNGPAQMEAKRKAIAQAAGAAGRSSTVLTSAPAASTIGGAYSGAKLGGA